MAIFPNAVPVRKSWDTAIIVLLFVVLVLASVTTDNFLTSLNISYIFFGVYLTTHSARAHADNFL